MNLSSLLLATFLILFSINIFGWVIIASWVIGVFALSAGIALLLEGLGVYNYNIRRQP